MISYGNQKLKTEDGQIAQWTKVKETFVVKTLHRILKPRANVPKGLKVPVSLVAPIVLLLFKSSEIS